ncbi:MAG: 5-formyltetrahydrofolate cyclo-ligase [Myxococcota bacterium]
MGNSFEGRDKAALRRELESRRRALTAAEVAQEGGEVHRRLAALGFFQAARTLALYDAQAFEVPTRPIFEAARARSVRCVYPRVVKGEKVLRFHVVETSADFVSGPLGLLQPAPQAAEIALADIDCFVVPGVGFTKAGARLGRGGGYYDATLALRRTDAWAVGVTFACGVVEWLPEAPWDVRVDAVVSSRGVALIRDIPSP